MQYEIRNYAPEAQSIRIDITEGKQIVTVRVRRDAEGVVSVTVDDGNSGTTSVAVLGRDARTEEW